jgi:hypothetical protein
MAGTMFALGIVLGVLIALVVVAGFKQRRYVDLVFPVALAIAVVVAVLSLLTGHGLLALAAAGVLAAGEAVGLVGTALLGGRVLDALEDRR